MKQYIDNLNRQLATGRAGEHTYRPALEGLLRRMLPPDCLPSNEPSRIECGAPDFIITRGGVPVSYIECKDLDDADLDGRRAKGGHKEQFDRYKAALGTIVFTDYLDFHLYKDAEPVMCVRVAELKNGKIKAVKGCEDAFAQLVSELATAGAQPCRTAQELAAIMAGKARLMTQVIRGIFAAGNLTDEVAADMPDTPLAQQFKAFKETLIKDLTPGQFADIYSQTLAYGLFAARLHYKPGMMTALGGASFCRQNAAYLIPPTNPLLQQIFFSISGPQLDTRVAWVVDSLAEAFAATDVAVLMAQYEGRGEDPMVHFYEDFLSAYDPTTRKQRGVWYTPPAVVGFIVRAADYLLEKELGVSGGLAADVQILDPATGTGTFIIEVIRAIKNKFAGQDGTFQYGLWKAYAASKLLPRLTGFEVLMASYAIAHLKVERELEGVTPAAGQRTQIFLTNSLEERGETNALPFAHWLTAEAREAGRIKSESRVMVMLGNPPYNGESANKGAWISGLMNDYKRDPDGGNVPNTKWVNDDYVKFIRLAQYYIARTGEGVIGFINPHGYLDSLSFRGMRYALLREFDLIYILNLHGNSNFHETAPDGGIDENVFCIRQGVCINLFVKHKAQQAVVGANNHSPQARVFYADLWGRQSDKYDWLAANSLDSVPWRELKPEAPMFFFAPKDFDLAEEYGSGVKIDELFVQKAVGICSKRDAVAFQDSREDLLCVLKDFKDLPEEAIKQKYNVTSESRDQKVSYAKANVQTFGIKDEYIIRITYRPFDCKWTYFTNKSKGFLAFPVYETMRHLAHCENVALVVANQCVGEWHYAYCSEYICDMNLTASARRLGGGTIFPLWLAPDEGGLIANDRRPNLRPEAVAKFAGTIGREPSPEEIFNYVYGVLYSPDYRKRYAEFLKVDFPRIPLPADAEEFARKAALGKRLIDLHLLRFGDKPTATYPIDGDNTITDIRWENGNVFINETQYFGGVSKEVWEYYIGGYQPMQKWLKDHKGRALEFEDIRHYMKIGAAIGGTIEAVNACEWQPN